MVDSESVLARFIAYIPYVYTQSIFVIKDVDMDVSHSEILEEGKNVLFVSRIKRKIYENGKIKFVDTSNIKVHIAGHAIPRYLVLWNIRFVTYPAYHIPIICHNCYKYGHVKRRCNYPSKVCYKCGDNYSPDHACIYKHITICLHCQDSHPTGSIHCHVYKDQSKLRETMFDSHMTFFEARNLLLYGASPYLDRVKNSQPSSVWNDNAKVKKLNPNPKSQSVEMHAQANKVKSSPKNGINNFIKCNTIMDPVVPDIVSPVSPVLHSDANKHIVGDIADENSLAGICQKENELVNHVENELVNHVDAIVKTAHTGGNHQKDQNENVRTPRRKRKQDLKIKEDPNFTLNPIQSKILEIKENFPVEHQYAKKKNKNGKS
uniref:CCHC-type domain-containing protein n=1 Tax=Cacopsylla melanoneura TaxID=428564 RepID=A0A8D8L8J5_9HEMI